MENFHWKEYWDMLKPSLRRSYMNLSEEDLQYTEGKEDQLIARLQQKLGKSPKEVNEVLFYHLIQADDIEEEKEIDRIIDQLERDLKNGNYLSDQHGAGTG